MKRINVMVSDEAKNVLIDYKNEHEFHTLDEANEAFLVEFIGIRTYKGNWVKKHIGCGGLIRYTENMDPSTPQVFDMECLKCGKVICEEETEFERR